MGFSDFLGQVALGAGRQIIYNQAQEERQADLEHKRNANAIQQEQLGQYKSQAQAQRAISDVMNASQATDKASVQTPQEKAKLYQQAADAASRYSPETAARMSALAKGQLDLAKEAETEVHKKIAAAKENLAQTAISFARNPSLEGQTEVAKAAMAAGVPMSQIPSPGSLSFAAWAKQQEVAGMTSKDILATKEKVREFDQKHEDQQKEWESRNKDRDALRAQTAAIAQGNQELRRMMVESTLEARAAKATSSTLTATEKNTVTGVLGASGEVTSGLEQVIKMPSNARIGSFGHLKDNTVLSALANTGANKLNTETTQMFQSLMGGMALEVGRVITLGAGKSPNDSTIRELERAIVPGPNDTEYTAMYKLATGARMVRARLETLPEGMRPDQKKHKDQQMEILSKIPDPGEILGRAQADKTSREQMAKFQRTLGEAMRPGSGSGTGSGTGGNPPAKSGIMSAEDWLKQ